MHLELRIKSMGLEELLDANQKEMENELKYEKSFLI